MAAVCFLGSGSGCGDSHFSNGDSDYKIDPSNQCRNEGYVSSCPAGQKLHKNNRCAYNSSFGTCCTENCPSNSSINCSGDVVADDGCGYECKACDPCPGYYACGGSWQYCEGTKCSADASRCSISCKADYFPYQCSNSSSCSSAGGIYRNGYCSKECKEDYSDWRFTCCDIRCAYSECMSIVGYDCENNPHFPNCLAENGTPVFNKCIGPDFDNVWDGHGPFAHNAAGYTCQH